MESKEECLPRWPNREGSPSRLHLLGRLYGEAPKGTLLTARPNSLARTPKRTTLGATPSRSRCRVAESSTPSRYMAMSEGSILIKLVSRFDCVLDHTMMRWSYTYTCMWLLKRRRLLQRSIVRMGTRYVDMRCQCFTAVSLVGAGAPTRYNVALQRFDLCQITRCGGGMHY